MMDSFTPFDRTKNTADNMVFVQDWQTEVIEPHGSVRRADSVKINILYNSQ